MQVQELNHFLNFLLITFLELPLCHLYALRVYVGKLVNHKIGLTFSMCQSWIRLFAWAGIAQSIFCSHSEDVNCVGIKTINILRRLVGVCLQCAIPVTVFPFPKLESTSVIGYKILGFLGCLKIICISKIFLILVIKS